MTTDEAQPVYDEEPDATTPPAAEPPQQPPLSLPVTPPQASEPRLPEKVPMTAALLSAAPGLGNIYNGLYGRGIAFFMIQFGLIRIAVATERDEDLAIVIPSIFFFWLFNIFDAYRQAVLLNLGGQRLPNRQARRSEAGGFLLPGIIMTLIGLVGVTDRYFGVYFWSLFDHWPALMLVAGVALVLRALVARTATRE